MREISAYSSAIADVWASRLRNSGMARYVKDNSWIYNICGAVNISLCNPRLPRWYEEQRR